MAGNYPDVPSWRMSYDVDGTQGYWMLSNFVGVNAQASQANLVSMNDESISTNWPPSGIFSGTAVCLIFPELRDLDGMYIAFTEGALVLNTLQTSEDTTNGVDGIWTNYPIPPTSSVADTVTRMRNFIMASTVLGIKAIRWQWNSSGGGTLSRTSTCHIFGEPSPGENLQRLEIWDPILDERLSPVGLDWGDVPRNTVEIREFRIKNMDPVLTANSVRAAMAILTDTTPSVVGQMAISKDGSSWGAQQTLSSPLGPGDISPVMYIRRTTPANATLSLWWYRLFADCTSWT